MIISNQPNNAIPAQPVAEVPPLWNSGFFVYWLSTLQSTFGSALTAVVTAMLVLQLTGKASAMGVTLALGLLPALLSPFAGVLVDRSNLKALLVISNILRGVLVLGLLYSYETHQMSHLVINSVALLSGLIGAFAQPAAGTLLPRLVHPQHLARASGLLNTGTQTAQLVGLLAGASIVTFLNVQTSLWLDAVSFFVMSVALMAISIPARVKMPERKGYWNDFKEGFQIILKHREFAAIPLLAFVINICFAPVQMLIPGRAVSLGLGTGGYGYTMGVLLAGMLLTSLTVVYLGQRFKPLVSLPIGLMMAGVALVGLGYFDHQILYFLSAALAGAGVALTNTAIAYLAQTAIAEEFRGRVFGLINAISIAGLPLTMLAIGPFADQLGPKIILEVGGVMVLITTSIWLLLRSQQQRRLAVSGS